MVVLPPLYFDDRHLCLLLSICCYVAFIFLLLEHLCQREDLVSLPLPEGDLYWTIVTNSLRIGLLIEAKCIEYNDMVC